MINNVVLVGRLTKDAELRYTGSGIAVASFTVAVNRPFKTNGEEEADFINCVVWRGTAEALSNYTRKGSLIGLTGRIQTRNYTNNEGRKVFITEVVAENVQFLEPKSNRQTESNHSANEYTSNNKNAAGGNSATNNSTQQNDWQQKQQGNWTAGGGTDEFEKDPFESNNDSIDISDDDLPF